MSFQLMPWLLLTGAMTVLTACASSSTGLPVVASEYCLINQGRMPVLLSRKDTPETIRQVAILNSNYERLCPNAEKPSN